MRWQVEFDDADSSVAEAAAAVVVVVAAAAAAVADSVAVDEADRQAAFATRPLNVFVSSSWRCLGRHCFRCYSCDGDDPEKSNRLPSWIATVARLKLELNRCAFLL